MEKVLRLQQKPVIDAIEPWKIRELIHMKIMAWSFGNSGKKIKDLGLFVTKCDRAFGNAISSEPMMNFEASFERYPK